MSNRTRAERRHENKRILAKRYRQNDVYWSNYTKEDNPWRDLQARKRVHTGTICSCYMYCRNARSKYGNSTASLTRQELIAMDHLSEQE